MPFECVKALVTDSGHICETPTLISQANVATDVQQTDVHIIELKELYLFPPHH